MNVHGMTNSSVPTKFPLTLLVMTFNEEGAIGRCLDSVPFAAEKIVIDSGSTDRTAAIARAHGARVIHQDWLGFGAQRIFATTQASHDWILFLDADEWLSDELRVEFVTRLPQLLQSCVAAAMLWRSTLFFGAPMRWYRPLAKQRVHRLYHRGRARWTDTRVHEAMLTDGKVIVMRGVLHEEGVSTLLQRQLKDLVYAELKARDWLERGKRKPLWQMPFAWLFTFLKDYFLRLGFMDGWRGFIAAYMAANYAAYKRLRYWEARHHPASVSGVDEAMQAVKSASLRARINLQDQP